MSAEAAAILSEVTKQTAEASQHDPIVVGLAFVLIVVVGVLAIAKPLMSFYREYKKTGVEGVKAEAEATLFQTLQQQIEHNNVAIERLETDRARWFEKAKELEDEVRRLTIFEESVKSMKDRLNEKDKIIEARDIEIRSLTRSILDMKDRIHNLELRTVREEAQFCAVCTYRKAQDEAQIGSKVTQ